MDNKKTILLIEDEKDYRDNLAQVLGLEGYRVLQAETGEQGIAMTREHLPDLVLSDLLMPGISGFEVLETIKRELKTAAIPVIILTAHADTDYIVKGLELGARDYVSKDTDNKVVLARIRTQFELKKKTDTLKRIASERLRYLKRIDKEKSKLEKVIEGLQEKEEENKDYIHTLKALLEMLRTFDEHFPDPDNPIKN